MSVSNNFDFSLILENSKSSILDFKLNTAFKPLLHMCSAACFRLPLYDIKITRDDEYKINSMSRFKYFHTRLESSTFILTEYFYNIAKKKKKKDNDNTPRLIRPLWGGKSPNSIFFFIKTILCITSIDLFALIWSYFYMLLCLFMLWSRMCVFCVFIYFRHITQFLGYGQQWICVAL